ncbi:MAG: hypothetical protein PHQ14_02880 [Chromatiales bacterium]|nr:hypothetical protein [Chromatiales bacterium]MDX9766925.1 hypothetical protein [Ectothiorhodospiraceae bacterium]
MGDVVRFQRPKASDKAAGRGLCASGFHKWEAVKEKPFDVKQGKLVTLLRCTRCGATRTEAR